MTWVILAILIFVVVLIVNAVTRSSDQGNMPRASEASRRSNVAQGGPVGRAVQVGCSVDEAVDTWVDLVKEWQPNDGEVFDVKWPDPPPVFERMPSHLFDPPEGMPDRVAGLDVSRGPYAGRWYCVVWKSGAPYRDKLLIWLVWPNYVSHLQTPVPLFGWWVQRESSFTGVGTVERDYWAQVGLR